MCVPSARWMPLQLRAPKERRRAREEVGGQRHREGECRGELMGSARARACMAPWRTHRMQMKMPRFALAQRGPLAPQSAHRLFAGCCSSAMTMACRRGREREGGGGGGGFAQTACSTARRAAAAPCATRGSCRRGTFSSRAHLVLFRRRHGGGGAHRGSPRALEGTRSLSAAGGWRVACRRGVARFFKKKKIHSASRVPECARASALRLAAMNVRPPQTRRVYAKCYLTYP